jgi:DNA-binding CsgD family transcriptional regulator
VLSRKLSLDFLDFCNRETDPARITERFVVTLQHIGYQYIACASHVDPLAPGPGAVSVINYPQDWLEQYSVEDFAHIDPVFLAACAQAAPFHWDDCLARMHLTRDQKRLLGEGASYGIKAGTTIPLRSPDISPASCTLIAGSDGVDPVTMPDTLMIVVSGYGALHRLLNPDAMIKPVMLARRERQCLALAGSGKSDWIIGSLLGVSERTAHNTIERAKKRYRVSNRVQAIMRAWADGQIKVDDLSR